MFWWHSPAMRASQVYITQSVTIGNLQSFCLLRVCGWRRIMIHLCRFSGFLPVSMCLKDTFLNVNWGLVSRLGRQARSCWNRKCSNTNCWHKVKDTIVWSVTKQHSMPWFVKLWCDHQGNPVLASTKITNEPSSAHFLLPETRDSQHLTKAKC